MVLGFRGLMVLYAITVIIMIREQQALKLLGDNIRKLRTQKKFSQEDFSNIAEIDRSYVGQVERGERNISFKNLFRIATALDVSVSELTVGI